MAQSFALKPFQIEAVDTVSKMLDKSKAGILSLDMGMGKTAVAIATVIKKFKESSNKSNEQFKVFVSAHSETGFSQFLEEANKMLSIDTELSGKYDVRGLDLRIEKDVEEANKIKKQLIIHVVNNNEFLRATKEGRQEKALKAKTQKAVKPTFYAVCKSNSEQIKKHYDYYKDILSGVYDIAIYDEFHRFPDALAHARQVLDTRIGIICISATPYNGKNMESVRRLLENSYDRHESIYSAANRYEKYAKNQFGRTSSATALVSWMKRSYQDQWNEKYVHYRFFESSPEFPGALFVTIVVPLTEIQSIIYNTLSNFVKEQAITSSDSEEQQEDEDYTEESEEPDLGATDKPLNIYSRFREVCYGLNTIGAIGSKVALSGLKSDCPKVDALERFVKNNTVFYNGKNVTLKSILNNTSLIESNTQRLLKEIVKDFIGERTERMTNGKSPKMVITGFSRAGMAAILKTLDSVAELDGENHKFKIYEKASELVADMKPDSKGFQELAVCVASAGKISTSISLHHHCDIIVVVDQEYKIAENEQLNARIVRIGQAHMPRIICLTTDSPIDIDKNNRIEKKWKLVDDFSGTNRRRGIETLEDEASHKEITQKRARRIMVNEYSRKVRSKEQVRSDERQLLGKYIPWLESSIDRANTDFALKIRYKERKAS